MRYFLDISFDGTNYYGWQIQKNQISVQEVLNEKISLLLRETINLVGCGRTDTGVHARQFFAHFDVNNEIDKINFKKKINSFLPEDISVNNIYSVVPNAHARYSAIMRTYRYYISLLKDPFIRKYSFYYRYNVNIELLKIGSSIIKNTKDFTAFTKTQGGQKHCLCEIYECTWTQKNNVLIFTITANRFTRNMVRSIVGTLLEFQRGKFDADYLKKIIDSKDRKMASHSVPPYGLFLEEVKYPTDIFLESL
ncbi:MAG: tRNA pseudouridine(38-40) synthase TruA [Bacteroidales bacterium]|nr:tRNA pseudouridine(38-40) synthase TruA [Bacteroidales bacterium]